MLKIKYSNITMKIMLIFFCIIYEYEYVNIKHGKFSLKKLLLLFYFFYFLHSLKNVGSQ